MAPTKWQPSRLAATSTAAAVFALATTQRVAAQSSCAASCTGTTAGGTKFDLSALMGTEFKTSGSDSTQDTYYLNVCGTSSTQCPDDAGDPPVTTGTAVQTVSGGGCYVLGAYQGDNCLWTANPGGQTGVELVLDNGSNNLCGDGSPRQVTIDFLCPKAGASAPLQPKSWTAMNLPGSCEYTYTFETCAACKGGCAGAPAGGLTWGGVFLIITLGACLPLYIIGGVAYNYQVKGERGADMFKINPGFWGGLCAYAKAGCVYTVTLGKSSGGDAGKPYDGMGAASGPASDVSYQNADAPKSGSVDF